MRSIGSRLEDIRRRAGRATARRERGFVLLVVLATLGLIALVAATFTHVTRSHVKAAAGAVEGARAEALADAGVQLAVLDILAAQAERTRRRQDARALAPTACSPERGARLTVSIHDEAGKVDLNIAEEPLLKALLAGLGIEPAARVAAAILDYRDDDDDRRLEGAERADYRAAGLAYGPKNAPLAAVEELDQVLGIRAGDLDRLRPFITVHSGQGGVDPSAASPELLAALARGHALAGLTSMRETMGGGTRELPAELATASIFRAFTIRSEARTASGAVFVRLAVVELTPSRPGFYTLRRWHRGAVAAHQSPDAGPGDLPPC